MNQPFPFRLAVPSLALLAGVPLPAQDPPAGLEVRVDARVELMGVLCRLAGFQEYTRARVEDYASAVDEWFGEHRDHEAVRLLRSYRRFGISYDAPMSLAVHVTPPPELAPRVDLDPWPERLDRRWSADRVRRFLEAARAFVADSDFAGFLAGQAERHGRRVADLEALLAEHGHLDWFGAFFGKRAGARFVLVPALLHGPSNYGPAFVPAEGTEELFSVIGAGRTGGDGRAVFDASVVPTVIHEFSHSFCNPLVTAHLDELEAPGRILHEAVAEEMRRQAYGNWRTVMNESLVRACVARWAHACRGPDAHRQRLRYEHGRGFLWTGELSDCLAEYEADREHHPDLASFMPQVVAFFTDYAAHIDEHLARYPAVVSTTPADGARDVDPGTRTLVIEFDRPMAPGSWSLVGRDAPEITGTPAYDDARRVLTVPVKLAPGTAYELWLNRGRFDSFRSARSVPLRSVAIRFRTRG